MDSYYIINSYINSNLISSSKPFYSKDEANKTKEILDNNDTTYNVIFKCSPIKKDKKDKMKLYSYAKGYLLIPNKLNPYYGMERLNKGDWCDDVEGWFYDKTEYDNLIELGYTLKDKFKIDYSNYNINTLEIYFYSNGFVLSPNKDYKYYGQKYLIGGIWSEKQKGWIFSNITKYNKFIKLGAIDHDTDTFME
jgi:hypothetical protein